MVKEDSKSGEMEHVNTLLDKLQQVSSEIDAIKHSFSKDMENLGKIQNMLTLEGVDKFSSMLEELEQRIMEAERRREEATEGAMHYSEELEREKERLMKLWDAYKGQEEELSVTEKKSTALEEQLREMQRSKEELEQDLTTRMETLTKRLEERERQLHLVKEDKQKITDLTTVCSRLEDEVRIFKNEITTRDETIQSLEKEVEELRKYEQRADLQNKFDEVSREYEKEKERLTKLFRLYEETEAENNRLKKDLKDWQEWFKSNEEIFSKLFTSADHIRKTMDSSPEIVPVEPTEPETEEMTSKRKLRFRK